jgi:glycopeptide antibiotics resistance protein
MKLALLLLWTTVIAGVTTLPWSDFTGHPHWDSVRWMPFFERPLKAADIVLNVILFVPFGYLRMRTGSSASLARRAVSTGVLAIALSFSAEYFQVYCHNRIPSATDVCTNVLGACFGILFRWRVESRNGDATVSVETRPPPSGRRA